MPGEPLAWTPSSHRYGGSWDGTGLWAEEGLAFPLPPDLVLALLSCVLMEGWQGLVADLGPPQGSSWEPNKHGLGAFAGDGHSGPPVFQLLNQFENTGPPPADKEKIQTLPTIPVTEEHVGEPPWGDSGRVGVSRAWH